MSQAPFSSGLASQNGLSDDEVDGAVQTIRRILPHMSDCDGLSTMVERLPSFTVQEILDSRDQSLPGGRNLLQWDDEVRARGRSPRFH